MIKGYCYYVGMNYIRNTNEMYYALRSGDIVSLHGKSPRVMKQKVNTKGYKQLGMTFNHGVKTPQAHRLIYEAFNGLIPTEYVVDHVNHDRADNRIVNLQLLTSKDNSRKARDAGRTKATISAARASGKKRAIGEVPQSGLPHIYWNKVSKRWFGARYIDGERYTGGYFKTPEEAATDLALKLP